MTDTHEHYWTCQQLSTDVSPQYYRCNEVGQCERGGQERVLKALNEREIAITLLRKIEDAGECRDGLWHEIYDFLNHDSKCCGFPTRNGRCTKCLEMDHA